MPNMILQAIDQASVTLKSLKIDPAALQAWKDQQLTEDAATADSLEQDIASTQGIEAATTLRADESDEQDLDTAESSLDGGFEVLDAAAVVAESSNEHQAAATLQEAHLNLNMALTIQGPLALAQFFSTCQRSQLQQLESVLKQFAQYGIYPLTPRHLCAPISEQHRTDHIPHNYLGRTPLCFLLFTHPDLGNQIFYFLLTQSHEFKAMVQEPELTNNLVVSALFRTLPLAIVLDDKWPNALAILCWFHKNAGCTPLLKFIFNLPIYDKLLQELDEGFTACLQAEQWPGRTFFIFLQTSLISLGYYQGTERETIQTLLVNKLHQLYCKNPRLLFKKWHQSAHQTGGEKLFISAIGLLRTGCPTLMSDLARAILANHTLPKITQEVRVLLGSPTFVQRPEPHLAYPDGYISDLEGFVFLLGKIGQSCSSTDKRQFVAQVFYENHALVECWANPVLHSDTLLILLLEDPDTQALLLYSHEFMVALHTLLFQSSEHIGILRKVLKFLISKTTALTEEKLTLPDGRESRYSSDDSRATVLVEAPTTLGSFAIGLIHSALTKGCAFLLRCPQMTSLAEADRSSICLYLVTLPNSLLQKALLDFFITDIRLDWVSHLETLLRDFNSSSPVVVRDNELDWSAFYLLLALLSQLPFNQTSHASLTMLKSVLYNHMSCLISPQWPQSASINHDIIVGGIDIHLKVSREVIYAFVYGEARAIFEYYADQPSYSLRSKHPHPFALFTQGQTAAALVAAPSLSVGLNLFMEIVATRMASPPTHYFPCSAGYHSLTKSLMMLLKAHPQVLFLEYDNMTQSLYKQLDEYSVISFFKLAKSTAVAELQCTFGEIPDVLAKMSSILNIQQLKENPLFDFGSFIHFLIWACKMADYPDQMALSDMTHELLGEDVTIFVKPYTNIKTEKPATLLSTLGEIVPSASMIRNRHLDWILTPDLLALSPLHFLQSQGDHAQQRPIDLKRLTQLCRAIDCHRDHRKYLQWIKALHAFFNRYFTIFTQHSSDAPNEPIELVLQTQCARFALQSLLMEQSEKLSTLITHKMPLLAPEGVTLLAQFLSVQEVITARQPVIDQTTFEERSLFISVFIQQSIEAHRHETIVAAHFGAALLQIVATEGRISHLTLAGSVCHRLTCTPLGRSFLAQVFLAVPELSSHCDLSTFCPPHPTTGVVITLQKGPPFSSCLSILLAQQPSLIKPFITALMNAKLSRAENLQWRDFFEAPEGIEVLKELLTAEVCAEPSLQQLIFNKKKTMHPFTQAALNLNLETVAEWFHCPVVRSSQDQPLLESNTQRSTWYIAQYKAYCDFKLETRRSHTSSAVLQQTILFLQNHLRANPMRLMLQEPRPTTKENEAVENPTHDVPKRPEAREQPPCATPFLTQFLDPADEEVESNVNPFK